MWIGGRGSRGGVAVAGVGVVGLAGATAGVGMDGVRGDQHAAALENAGQPHRGRRTGVPWRRRWCGKAIGGCEGACMGGVVAGGWGGRHVSRRLDARWGGLCIRLVAPFQGLDQPRRFVCRSHHVCHLHHGVARAVCRRRAPTTNAGKQR